MSFSLSSFLDCKNLQGIGTFGGIRLERIEFGTTLPELGSIRALEGCDKVCSFVVVALSSSSPWDNNSLFKLTKN